MSSQTRRDFLKHTTAAAATLTAGCTTRPPAARLAKRGPLIVSTWGFGKPANELALNVLQGGGSALDAVEQGDTPVPRLQIMAGENLAGTEVWVRVRDNGPGIHPDVLDKVFNPFFTTKDKGTGLGLALSKKVVDAHGGSMDVESDTEAGTEFVLTFPKAAGEAG